MYITTTRKRRRRKLNTQKLQRICVPTVLKTNEHKMTTRYVFGEALRARKCHHPNIMRIWG